MPASRTFTADRRAQGFRSQAHLDAFYAHFDHVRACADCGAPGAPMVLADNSLQPTAVECATATELFVATFAENFPLEPAPASDFTVSPIISDSRRRNRTPQFVCYVRRGDHVDVLRSCDRAKLETDRDHLLAEGATPA